MAPEAAIAPPQPPAAGEPAGARIGSRLHRVARWEVALALALAAVFLLGVSSSPEFTSSYNLFTLCTNIGDIAIIALPMTLIIMVGEIDLSVASTLAHLGRDARLPVEHTAGRWARSSSS